MEVDDAGIAASSVSPDLTKDFAGAGTEIDNNGVASHQFSAETQKTVNNGGDIGNNVDLDKSQKLSHYKRKLETDLSETSIKLKLSSDEDDDSTAFQTEGMKTLKRKRFKLRRSGSKDCLLGFDEESGEAEYVKDENFVDDGTGSSSDSPKQVKRFKKSPTTSKTSPKSVNPKSNINNIEKPLQPHVVGDNEDGMSNEPLKTQTLLSTTQSSKKSSKSELYKKPFEYGWKRELVWRSNTESKPDKADVYYITPSGKRLRSRSDIIPLLQGELTIDHFSFQREALGVGPEFECVRNTKSSSRTSAATLAAAAVTPNIGKRISKPKGPKGASPPPEGWTPTRALKVNNAALQSGSGPSRHSSSSTNAHITTSSSSRHHSSSAHGGGGSGSSGKHSTSSSSSKSKKNNAAPNSESSRTRDAKSTKSSSTLSSSTTDLSSSMETAHKPCTYNCPRANGKMPQLKCVKCLCLYHHECVGLNPQNCEYRSIDNGGATSQSGREYFCETCQPKSSLVTSTQAKGRTTTHSPGPSIPKPSHTTRSPRGDNKLQQTITVVKGKKYVMVTKPNAAPNASVHANDIENDLRQIKEGIQHTNRKSSASNTEKATAVERANKLFAANFFANVSYAYDALVCILKYLKIHERSRAASVCKLWHLAAKDTSLWQIVRMKNSKVCDWAGFAAALRRGETKHLDLRKMLLSSGRSDEMWVAFSEHIGTVCSLEVIDLCRCSARVVESLFESNRRLRVLNAVAINDDALNLENVGLMTALQELRLRTCEPSVILGELQPLRALTQLTHLSLTAVRGLGTKGIEVLAELTGLCSLELGECGDFDTTFATVVLPSLVNLQRLRLENGSETSCCTLSILDAVAELKHLNQLELVNFDIKPGFDEKLCLCVNIRKLLIIPTYISQSATTNHIVLNAVQQISDSLQVFTWGVTVELLRVTALYVDQCDESMKKKKHHFDECIPVLKPVPGALSTEEDDSSKQSGSQQSASDVPQIEILPLDKVETILGENLPRTKFTIVKVPYIATSKQQLVE